MTRVEASTSTLLVLNMSEISMGVGLDACGCAQADRKYTQEKIMAMCFMTRT